MAKIKEKKYLYRVYDFTGGLNTRKLPISLQPNEISNLQNFNYDNLGVLTKRYGYDRVNDTSLGDSAVLGLHSYYKSNGDKYLLAYHNQSIYSWDSNLANQATVKSGLTANGEPQFCTYDDKCYIVNNQDSMMQYDGTALTTVSGSPPITKYIKGISKRLFTAGNDTYPYRLYFSGLDDYTDWTSSYYVDLPSKGIITGLEILLDSLIVYEEERIWVLYNVAGDPDDWSLKEVSTDVGSVSQNSLSKVRNELFFRSRKGIHTFSGVTTEGTYQFDNLKAMSLSDPIKTTATAVNYSKIDECAGINFDDKYWLSIAKSGDGYNSRVLIFDYVIGRWTIYDGIYANCFTVFKKSTGDVLIFGDSRAYGFIYEYGSVAYDGATDSGTAESATDTTLTDTDKSWDTNEFQGCKVYITGGTGVGQSRTITSNTTDTLTVATWTTNPDATSTYVIGAIECIYESPYFTFDMPEKEKKVNRIFWNLKSKSTAGSYSLTAYVDKDQEGYAYSDTITISQNNADWGTNWGSESYWAVKDLKREKISLPTTGHGYYWRFKLHEFNADEQVCLYGYTIELDPLEVI
jgi:hypothetical protein